MTLRTFRRRTRRVLLWTSALLCAVLLAGWTRSVWVGDEVRHTVLRGGGAPPQRWAIAHGGGDVVVVRASGYLKKRSLEPGWSYRGYPPAPVRNNLPHYVSGFFGYGICHYRPTPAEDPGIVTYDAVTLPYWLLVIVTSSPWVALGWRRWRDRAARRVAAGLCHTCGYDLRASPGRCPECGRTTTTPALPITPSPGVT